MTTVLCFDTETIEHPEIPAKPCEDGKERVPAAPHLRIVAACGVVLESRYEVYQPDPEEHIEDRAPMGNVPRRGDRDLWYEATRVCVFGGVGAGPREILLGLAKAFKVAPVLVGFNSGGFDLRVIVAEALELGIQVPLLFDRQTTYRYGRDSHEDVQDTLSNYGAGRFGSQDAWARRCGLPGKMGVDGDKVKDLHRAGKHQEIADYCMCDCGQLSGVWLRKELIAGGLTLTGYQRSAASLVALAEATPALRAIVEHERFDRQRFLLEGAC